MSIGTMDVNAPSGIQYLPGDLSEDSNRRRPSIEGRQAPVKDLRPNLRGFRKFTGQIEHLGDLARELAR